MSEQWQSAEFVIIICFIVILIRVCDEVRILFESGSLWEHIWNWCWICLMAAVLVKELKQE